MKATIKLIAVILAIMMLLCSCDVVGVDTSTDTGSESESQTFAPTEDSGSESDSEPATEEETDPPLSEYRQSISRTREELEAMLTITDEKFTEADSQLEAFEKIALESTDVDAINAVYDTFEDTYYYISTQVSVASIIYYINMSDDAAYDRYNGYYEKYGDMHDKYMEKCKNIYLNSPVSAELFADWTEEEIKQLLNYSAETTELQLKNDELTDELNNLYTYEFKSRSAEIYAELVTNNNRIAELAGYDNYYDYATKEIYLRDYGREELEIFCAAVKEKYVPLYKQLQSEFQKLLRGLSDDDYDLFLAYLEQPFDSLETNYLEGYFNSLTGSMKDGMEHAFVNKNMVFSDKKNSHPTAFQTYLDDFEHPFCLFGSSGQSTSTIVHEIGHYYASIHNSDLTSYDLAEVQSQGNEMLLLNYLEGVFSTDLFNALKIYNMYASLDTLIRCVIIDEFEREVYALESVEGFESKDFDKIMDKICEEYGGEGGMQYIYTTLGKMDEYWRQVATNNPVYYISYAVSLSSALNLYAELDANTETGREMYRVLIEDIDEDDTFLSVLEKSGLPSPFTTESVEKVLSVVWGNKILPES